MPARAKPIAAIIEPAFWDTSAILPLCCQQPQSSTAHHAVTIIDFFNDVCATWQPLRVNYHFVSSNTNQNQTRSASFVSS
jgi:hypothetical protein